MTYLTFKLTTGSVLTVSRPRPDYIGGATPVSFYAAAGELLPDLRAELDAGIPVEFSGPDSELGAIVQGILGARHDSAGVINTPVARRGESVMEALQRAVDHDRATNNSH